MKSAAIQEKRKRHLLIQQAIIFNSNTGLEIARLVVAQKILNQYHLLVHASERLVNKDHFRIDGLLILANKARTSSAKRELLLIEARAAKKYWLRFSELIDSKAEWKYRKSAEQPVIRLLNVGYHYLSVVVRKALIAGDFETGVGFLHQYRRGHDPLVYDIMEIFRQPVVDAALLTFIRRRKVPLVEGDEITVARFVQQIKKQLDHKLIQREYTQLKGFVLGKTKSYTPYRWKWGHKKRPITVSSLES